MAPSTSRLLAVAASAVVAVGLALGALTGAVTTLVSSAVALFAVAAAWVVVRYEPRSPVGPALAWTSASVALVTANDVLAASAYTDAPLPLSAFARHWWVGCWPVNLAGVLALLLVFPSGRRRGWLWSAVPWVYAVATVGMISAEWDARQVDGHIVGDPTGYRLATVIVCMALVAICLVLAVVRLVLTYREGVQRTRLQIRWLLLAGGGVVALLVLGWLLQVRGATIGVAFAPFLLATVLLVPAAVGIAVLRHDLLDVDRLLTSSATWALTLLFSAGVFGVVVLAVGQVVHRFTPMGSSTAAFVTARVLLPLKRHVDQTVGRFIDRDRHVALASVERFAAQVRSGEREPEEIEEVLRTAQGDPGLRVLLVNPGRGWVTMDGTPTEPADGFTIETGGDAVARIVVGKDAALPRARRRVAELSRAAWLPIEVSRLRLALRETLAQAQASRSRLAHAAAAERRRLEKDLHDGAQQRLLATGMRLRVLQRRLPEEEASEVDAAVTELRQTVEELRRLANGVRPSRLDDGLAAALAAVRDASPVPFGLHVGELPPVNETRTLTAYLVVSEAVANALKHARASRIDVTLAGAEDGRLTLQVSDDGIGGIGPDAPLQALRDRVLSVGGDLELISPAGGGTTIRAFL